jgi:membrane protein DedA with SNARE-associated domain
MSNSTSRHVARLIAIPVIFLLVFGSLYFVWDLLDLPPEDVAIEIARNYFERYGLITVFIGAFIEGLILIGWYFPGAIVILAALLIAGADAWAAAQVLLATMAGLSTAYIVNFLLGKYGWYRLLIAFGLREGLEHAKARLTKYGLSTIFTTYWQMNLASLTSTAAGILHFPAAKFVVISVAACVAWITFWGSMIFFLGQAAAALVSLRVIIAVIAAWIVGRVIYARLRAGKSREPRSG